MRFAHLRLLSDLAQMPVANVFKPERHRGDPVDSFFSAPHLRVECDFDLSHTPHPFDPSLSLTHPLLHYDLGIVFHEGVLEVESEKLWGALGRGTGWEDGAKNFY